jgi:queuine tRNA-ribosyltransferase
MASLTFRVEHVDPRSQARRGLLETPHGHVDTPAFMPVGTQATVKGVTVDQLRACGAQMVLGNTYHLAIRPGAELIASLGGLHRFMGWDRPILTDSGGFQIFSLAKNTVVTEEKATFRSHVDGSLLSLSPEDAVRIQEILGSDIAMVLDHVIGLPAERDRVRDAMQRSIRWAVRCRDAARSSQQSQFAIVQGGLDEPLRVECAEKLAALDFPTPVLPANKPRYLMGVGRPIDLLEAIARGVDLFDCVLPTRNGRNALAYTDQGTLRLRNLAHQSDAEPLETDCPCPACRHSRAYLRHLFMAGEMLGPILLTIHNLTFFQRLMARAREAIATNRFDDLLTVKRSVWGSDEPV